MSLLCRCWISYFYRERDMSTLGLLKSVSRMNITRRTTSLKLPYSFIPSLAPVIPYSGHHITDSCADCLAGRPRNSHAQVWFSIERWVDINARVNFVLVEVQSCLR
jgi:hypothetical protein